jgi:hypothetical protein
LVHPSKDDGSAQEFAPSDEFLKWIAPIHIKHDRSLSSAAFTNYRMSVNWAILSSIEETLGGREGHGVVSITAELWWSLNQEIERTPIPNDNPDNYLRIQLIVML